MIIKKVAKSKTMWFATALAIAGALEQNMGLLMPLLGPHYGTGMVIVGTVVAILRTLTTKPLSEK